MVNQPNKLKDYQLTVGGKELLALAVEGSIIAKEMESTKVYLDSSAKMFMLELRKSYLLDNINQALADLADPTQPRDTRQRELSTAGNMARIELLTYLLDVNEINEHTTTNNSE